MVRYTTVVSIWIIVIIKSIVQPSLRSTVEALDHHSSLLTQGMVSLQCQVATVIVSLTFHFSSMTTSWPRPPPHTETPSYTWTWLCWRDPVFHTSCLSLSVSWPHSTSPLTLLHPPPPSLHPYTPSKSLHHPTSLLQLSTPTTQVCRLKFLLDLQKLMLSYRSQVLITGVQQPWPPSHQPPISSQEQYLK